MHAIARVIFGDVLCNLSKNEWSKYIKYISTKYDLSAIVIAFFAFGNKLWSLKDILTNKYSLELAVYQDFSSKHEGANTVTVHVETLRSPHTKYRLSSFFLHSDTYLGHQ